MRMMIMILLLMGHVDYNDEDHEDLDEDHDDEHLAGLKEAEQLDRFDKKGPRSFTQSQDRPIF